LASFKSNIIATLEKLRVRNQIRLIILLSFIGLLTSVLVLSLLGVTLNNYIHLQERLLNAERQLADVRFDHAVIQGNMQEFIRRPSPIKAREFQQKITSLKANALDLRAFAAETSVEISEDKVLAQLNNYNQSFNMLWDKFQLLGLGLDQGLQRDLNVNAERLKRELKEYENQTLEIALLDIRQNEKNYFLTNMPIMLVEMKRLYDHFKSQLEASDLAEADKRSVSEMIEGYYEIFVQASYVNADVQQAKLDLEARHQTFASNLEAWISELRDELLELKADAEDRINTFIVVLLSTAVLLALAVFFAGRFITYTITRPITELVRSLQGLARGKRELDIPFTDLDNEIGQIAQAAEVFKESLYEAEKGAVAEAKRQALEESNQELEIKVQERTEELADRNDALKEAVEKLKVAQDELLEREKLAALGSLVAGVSHELNTPLGNALTVLTSISDETNQITTALESGEITQTQLKTYLEYSQSGLSLAEKNLSRAGSLVKNFKQVAVDQTSESRREFDLKEVTDEIVETLKPSYKHQAFEFITDIPDHIVLDSYPGPYGQVISNLINNACLHGFDKRPYGSIRISAKTNTEGVCIVVSDDGVGMPENIQQRIFEPFYTTKLGQGGSGLGMNIVYNMVTGILGGKIQIFSKEKQGTQIELKLPMTAPNSSDDTAMAFGQD